MQVKEKVLADIKTGERLEQAVKDKLEKNGWHCVHVPGKFKYWDFAISKGSMVSKVEVKYDRRSDETGNYAIEKKWLDETIASLLIIGTLDEAYMIPVDDVRELVKGCYFRQMGDSPLNEGWPVYKPMLINKAQRFL